MFEIYLTDLLNTLISGIVLMSAFFFIINRTQILANYILALYWLGIFFYLALYSLEYGGIISNDLFFSDMLLFFMPIIAFIYLYRLYYPGIKWYLLLLFLLPLTAVFFKDTVLLFPLFYDLVLWTILIIASFYLYYSKKKRQNEQKRKLKYAFLWTIFTAFGFFPYIIINLALSLIKKEPIQILLILPAFLCLSAFCVFFLFNNTYKYLNNHMLKLSSLIDKQPLTEKVAASLIHEIKNPITAIQSLNEQLQTRFNSMPEETIKKYLSIIANDLNRIKNLSDSFLKSSKRELNISPGREDIYLVVQSVYDLIRFDLQKKEINFHLDKSLFNVKIKFNNYQLRQIFINLFYNSMEAGAKNITITCTCQAKSIALLIEDDGSGIALHHQKTIFLPFYTTKSEGTGLGLAICKKILNQNNGEIILMKSKKGVTQFKVSLSKQEDND